MTEPIDIDALCTFCADLMASDRTENETRLIAGIAGLVTEIDALRRRAEQLQQLVAEQIRRMATRGGAFESVYCELCGGEWSNIADEDGDEVHTETCWVARARAALKEQANA